MMTKEGSAKIVNFMTDRAVVLHVILGRDHISHYSKYAFSSTIYSTLIAIVLIDYYFLFFLFIL